jgi:alpha-L-fucosidase
MGIAQLPNSKLEWLLDAKLGMFIHWGLYSAPARGEWFMEHAGILPEEYRRFAFPGAGDWFDAADYHPEKWAALAKAAGMKWMCLTARHHEGFCLFDSPYPAAFTSMQTLHRDLFGEYVTACRAAGLRVGFYYSPLSWRYPGYYDVTGEHSAPNRFGYKTDPVHRENARIMKEENYVNVKKLLTSYGKIDQIFWDGGWIAQQGTDADGAYFHEPGKFLDPNNRWPISKEYLDFDPDTGKPLGIMGMVRKCQPDAITNLRYGWMGDIVEEEGPRQISGPIRSSAICDKNLSMQRASWGYDANAISRGNVMTCDDLINYLANCVVRDMVFLINVSPDRHGVIPKIEQDRLTQLGQWLQKMGDGIYRTRAGPWQPVDQQYGYCYKGSTLFIHLLKGYTSDEFDLPRLSSLKTVEVRELYSGRSLPYAPGDHGTKITAINRTDSPTDSIIAVTFDAEIDSVWEQ